MKPTVYIETTIIGYLAMRVSGVLRIAANQQTTREWWENRRQQFDLFVSRFVVDECSGGDPVAAHERLSYLQGSRFSKFRTMSTPWQRRSFRACRYRRKP